MTDANSSVPSASTSDHVPGAPGAPAGAGLTGLTARTVEVEGARVSRWVAGFADRHGATTAAADPQALHLVAADGATASLTLPFPPWTPPGEGVPSRAASAAVDGSAALAAAADGAAALAAAAQEHACAHRDVAVLIVRRGGYACVRVRGGAVAGSKVGSRYVQGRTAAGGWSQQRFARRRDKQAHELEKAVVEVAERVLLQGDQPQWLVTGGDRPLLDAVLADPRLRRLDALPRGGHLSVGDPDRRLVEDLPRRLTGVSILVRQ